MKYERMKRNDMRCNAIATTDKDIEKIVEDILRVKESASVVAINMKQKFPALMKKVRQLALSHITVSEFSLAFSWCKREINKGINYIDSAVIELNKGSLPTCVKFLNLAKETMNRVTGEILKHDTRWYPEMGEVYNAAWAIVARLVTCSDVLEKISRKISSM